MKKYDSSLVKTKFGVVQFFRRTHKHNLKMPDLFGKFRNVTNTNFNTLGNHYKFHIHNFLEFKKKKERENGLNNSLFEIKSKLGGMNSHSFSKNEIPIPEKNLKRKRKVLNLNYGLISNLFNLPPLKDKKDKDMLKKKGKFNKKMKNITSHLNMKRIKFVGVSNERLVSIAKALSLNNDEKEQIEKNEKNEKNEKHSFNNSIQLEANYKGSRNAQFKNKKYERTLSLPTISTNFNLIDTLKKSKLIAMRLSEDKNYILSKEYLTDNAHLPSSKEVQNRLLLHKRIKVYDE